MTHQVVTHQSDLNLVSLHDLFEHTRDVFRLTAQRAFQIFESRRHAHGNDREDWFLVETELLTPVKFRLSVSGDQLIALAEVPGFHRDEIKVIVEPRRLTISGKTERRESHKSGKHEGSVKRAQLIWRAIGLPTEVDLSRARATFSDDTLVVVMPKTDPAKSLRVETKLALSA